MTSGTRDIRLHVGFQEHPKLLQLRRMLGADGVLDWIGILSFCAQYRLDGLLSDLEPEDIKDAARYPGDATELVDALIRLRLIDRSAFGLLSVHGWGEHQPFGASFPQRQEAARQAIAKRWARTKEQAPAKPTRRKPKKELPADFSLSDGDREFCEKHGGAGRDIAAEFERFKAHHQAKGSELKDFHAGWRTWVLNAEKWAAERNGKKTEGRLPPLADEYFNHNR
jgi:hypothetical protein